MTGALAAAFLAAAFGMGCDDEPDYTTYEREIAVVHEYNDLDMGTQTPQASQPGEEPTTQQLTPEQQIQAALADQAGQAGQANDQPQQRLTEIYILGSDGERKRVSRDTLMRIAREMDAEGRIDLDRLQREAANEGGTGQANQQVARDQIFVTPEQRMIGQTQRQVPARGSMTLVPGLLANEDPLVEDFAGEFNRDRDLRQVEQPLLPTPRQATQPGVITQGQDDLPYETDARPGTGAQPQIFFNPSDLAYESNVAPNTYQGADGFQRNPYGTQPNPNLNRSPAGSQPIGPRVPSTGGDVLRQPSSAPPAVPQPGTGALPNR